MEIRRQNLKVIAFRAFVVLAFAVLALQSWQLQIVQGGQYLEQADRNRFRLQSIDAPRGVIYDRDGRLLAGNVPSFAVSIVPADLPEEDEEHVFRGLSSLLEIPISARDRDAGGAGTVDWRYLAEEEDYEPEAQLRELLAAGRESPFTPVRVKSNVSRETAFIIEEQRLDLPGVIVEIEPLREYISSTLFAHITGYVGHIPEQQLDSYMGRSDGDYDPNDVVGLTGVELTYESQLRGQKGQRHVEVDVTGRELRTIGSPVAPVPGYNLVLTIDAELQTIVAEALQRGIKKADSDSGVAVAMDPQTGEILAMVSVPSYDANLFVRAISEEDYEQLKEDPGHPLVNHAISGQYPPGSTFKIVTASAGLEEGVVTRNSLLFCPGTIWIPHRFAPDDPELAQPFNCWLKTGHRSISVVEALAQSCDIYFGVMAGGYGEFQGLGQEALYRYAQHFGLGQPTGIDLPAEAEGLAPDATWKRLTYGETWVTGDTYNAAMGQGFVLTTPLQMLNAAASVANGGSLYRPIVVREISDFNGNLVRPFAPHLIRKLPVSSETLELVRAGMRGAVTHGTAMAADLAGVAVAGKTGTAEYPGQRNWQGHLPTHAWFVAFAPFDDPEIALLVFVEGGGEGSTVAVPIAVEILAYYFGLSLTD
ncbi:MAG TPA: penicillin-binding protein 2 [Anaerolineae bacterium]|nr:penicillin-binding protein 2 [Anaerolineae bacterium]